LLRNVAQVLGLGGPL